MTDTLRIKLTPSALVVFQTEVLEIAQDPGLHGVAEGSEEAAGYQMLHAARRDRSTAVDLPVSREAARLALPLLIDIANLHDEDAENEECPDDRRYARAVERWFGKAYSKLLAACHERGLV